MAGEFERIETYFKPLAGPEGLALSDDAALIAPKAGCDLIVTKDLLIEDVHFRAEDPAGSVAHKCLAVNVSDLAAKGAEPAHYFIGLAVAGDRDDAWFQAFSDGLRTTQEQFAMTLAGGDTTRSPGPVMISVTAMGYVPHGQMVKRSGARPGDKICVSGPLGDAAFGLMSLQRKLPDDAYLIERYQRPMPRVALGRALRGKASACADISDGLIADLGHICKASGVGATVQKETLPVSAAVRKLLSQISDQEALIWSGGDDYELVFTVPVSKVAELKASCPSVTVIGEVTEGAGVTLLNPDGTEVNVARAGYQHF